MRGSVTVHEAAAFDSWVAEEGAAPAAETPAPGDTTGAEAAAGSEAAAAPGHDHKQTTSEGEERA
jgi:heme/copper-type cytochrome/quinol oxidase subunit 2